MKTAITQTVAVRTETAPSRRSNALAERLEQGAGALATAAAALSEKDWQKCIPHDGRPIGVVVHHVATMYPLEIQLAQTLAAGHAVTGVTWDAVHDINATHARRNEGVTKADALNLLQRMNHDVAQLRSKPWDEFAILDAPKLDFVFTVCDNAAAETCPVWPGQPMTAHWGVPDPAKAQGSEAEHAFAFDDTYCILNQRISIFVNLPIESLSRLSLQRHLDEIGGAYSKPSRESA